MTTNTLTASARLFLRVAALFAVVIGVYVALVWGGVV